MFRYLTATPGLVVKVYYYDPGLAGKTYDPGYGTSEKWDVDLLSGTDAQVLANPFRGRELKMSRQFNPGALAAMLQHRFDVILVCGYASPTNWLVLAAAALIGARVLYQADTNILDLRRKSRAPFRDWLRRRFLRRVDHFLVIGDKNREAYLSYGIPEKRLTWCPYPVDEARYEAARTDPELPRRLRSLRERYAIPEGADVVVFCGKLIPRKRPGDLVEALRLMRRKDVYGLLIGSGELEAEIRGSLQADDRIRITGFVNQSQIPYHMLLGTVGVVTSEWDPHPLVTTEFAMCGLPLVVSDFCGVWGPNDILQPGENGFVYPGKQTTVLARCLDDLLADVLMRERFGQCSLARSRKQSAAYAAEQIAGLLLSPRADGGR